MKWTDLITREAGGTYNATYGLIGMLDDSMLGWKPKTGENWMTVGQLLEHITIACGFCMRGFVTGQWCPDERTEEQVEQQEMFPPAEKLPSVASIKDALKRLKEDEQLAYKMIAEAGEKRLDSEQVTAPWGSQGLLGNMLLDMVGHLGTHKCQLFYYLKLMGKPVNTFNMYGMSAPPQG